jgi:hypothetical protein
VALFLQRCGIREVRTAPQSPWQNPYVERFIGTLRRELLDHVIVLNEHHLQRLLGEFVDEYYHVARPHQGLGGDTPTRPRAHHTSTALPAYSPLPSSEACTTSTHGLRPDLGRPHVRRLRQRDLALPGNHFACRNGTRCGATPVASRLPTQLAGDGSSRGKQSPDW